jgi:ethanolamine utilization protein EutM
MSGLIEGKALGLIETVGLIGAIEACDAAAKAADVIVSAAEITDSALVTLKIFGELGAVQSAVEAGAKAASRVGQLLSAHVIPNPDNNLNVIMGGTFHPGQPMTPQLEKPLAGLRNTLPKSPRPKNRKVPENTGNVTLTDDIENMRVTQLRAFARTIPNFPIKGREISHANKDTLLKEIRNFKGKK